MIDWTLSLVVFLHLGDHDNYNVKDASPRKGLDSVNSYS